MRRALVPLLLAAQLLASTLSLAGEFFPSPADWRDQVIYQVITDRFANGDPSNDAVEGFFDPSNGFRIHGGDFKGLEAKLDYMQTLGVTAIWISPVPLNAFAEYHGFAARDHRTIAPHFGGLDDLQSFVQAAHARGIYVIIDVVCNHMGNLIGSRSPGYPAFQDPGTYTLEWWNAGRRHAPPFDDLDWYHSNGEVQNFVDPEQILGELFGLDDLRTEAQEVRDELVDVFTWLIRETDCDGFRVDTVKHVELSFWQEWVPRVRAFADSIGKANFIFFGEVFSGSDYQNGIYTGTQAGGAFAFNSMLYFPMYFTTNDVFIYNAGTTALSSRYNGQFFYDPDVRDHLVRFLDNHDVPRFLSLAGGDEQRLRTALAFHLTSQGVPALYYGTEQGFDGGNDPFDREDMFDGEWEFGPSLGDNFDEASPLFLYTQHLLQLRSRYRALRRGAQVERLAVGTPGIYAFSRVAGSDEVLVILNTSTDPKAANNLATTWPPGTVLQNLLDGAQTTVVEPLGTVDVALAGLSAWLLVPASSVVDLGPRVIGAFPRHAGEMPWLDGPVRLGFSKPMHESSVEVRFEIDPIVQGSMRWSGERLEFHPFDGWSPGQEYRLIVEVGAHDLGSPPQTLPARFESRFEVAASAQAIGVVEGFEVETWASAGLSVPEGIEFASGDFEAFCFVGDEAAGAVLALDNMGDARTFSASGVLGKPEGLEFDAGGAYGGGILIADSQGVFKLAPTGSLSLFLSASSESQTGWLAIDPGSGFGGRLHLGSNAANWVRSYATDGTPATLATGINGFEGGAFGPGGAWGTDLYVADPDLTVFLGGIDGTGSILRITPASTVDVFASAGDLTKGIAALAFDAVGHFGGDLFAADIAQERVLRLKPDGQVSVFASGFGNLFSSDCLAFDSSGGLYVVDTGSGQGFTDTSGGTAVGRILRFRPTQGSDVAGQTPLVVKLSPNVPNPFNPSTTLHYEIPIAAQVQIDIVDVGGRQIRRLLGRSQPAGSHSLRWDGRDETGRPVASGVYVVRLRAAGLQTSRTVTLIR